MFWQRDEGGKHYLSVLFKSNLGGSLGDECKEREVEYHEISCKVFH